MSFDPKTPQVAVDVVLIHETFLLLITRKYSPLGYALPGGFIDVGETPLQAALREAQEETGIVLSSEQMTPLGILDDPKRDPRRHVISFGFAAFVTAEQFAQTKAGDDAADAAWYPVRGAETFQVVLGHDEFIRRALRQGAPPTLTKDNPCEMSWGHWTVSASVRALSNPYVQHDIDFQIVLSFSGDPDGEKGLWGEIATTGVCASLDSARDEALLMSPVLRSLHEEAWDSDWENYERTLDLTPIVDAACNGMRASLKEFSF